MRLRDVDHTVPATSWAWDGLVPDAAVTLLYGDGDSGKFMVALFLGASAYAGLPVLGREVRRGPVLYLDAELDAGRVAERARSVARGLGLDGIPADLHYH